MKSAIIPARSGFNSMSPLMEGGSRFWACARGSMELGRRSQKAGLRAAARYHDTVPIGIELIPGRKVMPEKVTGMPPSPAPFLTLLRGWVPKA